VPEGTTKGKCPREHFSGPHLLSFSMEDPGDSFLILEAVRLSGKRGPALLLAPMQTYWVILARSFPLWASVSPPVQ
jgi:hypothetical protein